MRQEWDASKGEDAPRLEASSLWVRLRGDGDFGGRCMLKGLGFRVQGLGFRV